MLRYIAGLVLMALVPLPAVGQALHPTAELIRSLTDAPGASALEEAVREIVVQEYDALGASIAYNGLGSALATHPGSPDAPRVMVTAHLDEVGLMIQYVTPEGFIRVKTLGGWLRQVLLDQHWVILGRDGAVPAVSGLRTTHVTPPYEKDRVWALEETFLDVEARSREEVGRARRPSRRRHYSMESRHGPPERPVRRQGVGRPGGPGRDDRGRASHPGRGYPDPRHDRLGGDRARTDRGQTRDLPPRQLDGAEP